MSMIGNYLRLSEADLNRLIHDHSGLSELLYPNDGENSPPAGSHLDIDKSWQAIHFLLTGHLWKGAPPLSFAVMGGQELGDEDVGYGPARYLTSDEVKQVAAALATIPGVDLWKRFDAKAFTKSEIYPHGWDESGKDYILGYYEQVRNFFVSAAADGDAMLLYLN